MPIKTFHVGIQGSGGVGSSSFVESLQALDKQTNKFFGTRPVRLVTDQFLEDHNDSLRSIVRVVIYDGDIIGE